MSNQKNRDQLLPPLWVLVLIALFLFLWVLYQLKEMLVLLVLGYCIAYLLHPSLSFFERRRIPRSVGFFLVFLILGLFATFLAITAIPTISLQYLVLTQNLSQYSEVIKQRFNELAPTIMQALPADMTKETLFDPQHAVAHVQDLLKTGIVKQVFYAVGETLLKGYSLTLTIVNIFLLPFIVFYLAVDFRSLHSAVLSFFPSSQRRYVTKLVDELNSYVAAFVRGQFSVGCILFLLYVIGLYTLGVDLWLLLAVISGFGSFIPFLGFILGIIASSLMSLATFGTWSALIKVWILYGIIQLLESNFITPKVVGSKVGISPLVIMLALVCGGKLFGLLGVLLAVPGTAVLKVLFNHGHAWVLKRVAN